MPFEFMFAELPAGYAAHDSSASVGGTVELITREFTSSDDGELFISRLEGLPATLLAKLPAPVSPSQVDHLLAIIYKDRSCKVYVNELQFLVHIRPTRTVTAGDAIVEDDVADINELRFGGLDIPADAAVILLFSAKWRKGFFFDFKPILPNGEPRDYDLAQTLGGFYAFLSNLSVFNLDESQWKSLLQADWFPFITLPKRLLNSLVARARDSKDFDALIPQIAETIRNCIPQMLKRWESLEEFAPHLDLLKQGASRYLEGDFVSTVAIIFPRIEGILRAVYSRQSPSARPNQRTLAGTLLHRGGKELQPYSWLLPVQFQQYLTESYFADFVPGDQPRLSRHSIGHGVANPTDFNEKHASIAFLILDQMFFLMRAGKQ